MKYEDALGKVENWLEKTGIRRYCREICDHHGCCHGLYCDGVCERPPLSCSIFICDDLKQLIGMDLHQSEEFKKRCKKIWKLIEDRCHIPEEIRNNLELVIPDRLIYSIIMNDFKLKDKGEKHINEIKC